MIKCIYFLKRKSGMTPEEFHKYWRDVHAPIAGDIPGVKKYILCYPLPSEFKDKEPAYDGIAEMWYDSEKSLAKAMASEAWKISGKDGEVFIDQASSKSMICGEDKVM